MSLSHGWILTHSIKAWLSEVFKIDFQLCQFIYREIHITCTDYLAASFTAPSKARQRNHEGVIECCWCCWGSVWISSLREIIGDTHAWCILSLWCILKDWKEKENRFFSLTGFFSSYCYDQICDESSLGVEGFSLFMMEKTMQWEQEASCSQ